MCGHEFGQHFDARFCVLMSAANNSETCKCKKFQLDNLKFIEWLAKKRKLV